MMWLNQWSSLRKLFDSFSFGCTAEQTRVSRQQRDNLHRLHVKDVTRSLSTNKPGKCIIASSRIVNCGLCWKTRRVGKNKIVRTLNFDCSERVWQNQNRGPLTGILTVQYISIYLAEDLHVSFFVSLDICVYNFDGQDILGWRGSVVLFDLVLQKVIFLVLFKIIFILN